MWEKLLLEYFENEMRAPSSAQPLMANVFTQTERLLLFTWNFFTLFQVVFSYLDLQKKLFRAKY